MSDYAAFLRGINVGKAHRVGSAELRGCFEAAGLSGVATFRTSGNVAFDGDGAPAGELRERIETALEGMLGYEVSVFLRSAGEMRAIAAEEPFPAEQVEGSKGKVQVVLLTAKPGTAERKSVLRLATESDALAFGDRELYWLPSGGTQESELDLKAIGKELGVTTMRTKGTVDQMAAKFFAA
ncbi:MAG TPA: DUF1697 domain-containing protein [Thermoleophilaceae bacterium]|nr:DUF1697 domain-containing protein [Thermoleophilaceae bacterium]